MKTYKNDACAVSGMIGGSYVYLVNCCAENH